MMRSLYSGVSGMQAHQTMLDVVSNNIANVNTTGFKKGEVTFKDMLSQTISGATAGTASTTGGTNAAQIGTGVSVAGVNNIQTQGASSTTGNSTDLMIQGEGYFTLTDGTNKYYTRAGAFSVDSAGNLVNSSGMMVCDDSGTAITGLSGAVSVSAKGAITCTGDSSYSGTIGLATFTNPEGLTKAGGSLYTESAASGTATDTTPGTNSGTLVSGSLEMSNVDLASEFVNMIVAERGYQANAKTIQTADQMLQTLINLKN